MRCRSRTSTATCGYARRSYRSSRSIDRLRLRAVARRRARQRESPGVYVHRAHGPVSVGDRINAVYGYECTRLTGTADFENDDLTIGGGYRTTTARARTAMQERDILPTATAARNWS
jgi:hypothetical protein